MLSISELDSTKYARQIYKNVHEQVPELKFEKALPETQKNLVILVNNTHLENHPDILKPYLANETIRADLKDNKKVTLYRTGDSKLFERAVVYISDLDTKSTREKIANFAIKISDDLVAMKARDATIYFEPSLKDSLTSEAIGILASVIILRAHKFERKNPTTEDKIEKPQKAFDNFTVVSDFLDREDKEFRFHTSVYKYTIFAREFVCTRANIANTTFVAELAHWIKDAFPAIEVNMIEGENLAKQGLNLIYNVGRGSEHPPRMITLKYHGKTSSEEFTGLVGKGIVFDSGGLNIKTGMMELMYGDKGGAVAVFATLLGIAELKLPVNVVVGLGMAENSVDSRSYRPSDIIRSLNGLTVAIGNTDAEGRLVLADTMTWVQRNFKVTKLIDVATLTGACMVALGTTTAGLFANDDELAAALMKASEGSFEDLWRLPIKDEHRDLMKSPVADLDNLGATTFGGASKAAAFLEKFVEKDVKWSHLDIAGPGIGMSDWIGHRKGGTGFGVRLLLRYFYE